MSLLIRILAAIGLALVTYLLIRFAVDLPDKEASAFAITVGMVCGYCGSR